MLLKLEKWKSRYVRVSFKKDRRLFTPNFLQAFAIALLIHVFALVFFQISSFKMTLNDTIFTPVQVRIDYEPLIDGGVLAELENKPAHGGHIAEPPLDQPQIVFAPTITLVREHAYPRMVKIPDTLLDSDDIDRKFIDSVFYHPEKHIPLTVKCTGGLETKKYVVDPIDDFMLQDAIASESAVVYRVKVEDMTGRIFWHECMSGSLRKKTRFVGEKILGSIRFEQKPDGFITEGIVELELSRGKENSV